MTAALITQNISLIAIALAVAILFLALIANRRRKNNLPQQLSRLVMVVFACLIAPEYSDNIYLFERRVHKQKMKCIRLLKGQSSSTRHHLRLFEIILDVGQLRRRISDYTVLGLCENELVTLQEAMTGLITAVGELTLQDRMYAAYAHAINQFEDIFEHVVKVAAREPLVFILFIGALRELQHMLQVPAGSVISEQDGVMR